MVIGAQPPLGRVGLVLVGIPYVRVCHVLRHRAVHEHELRIAVIPAQLRRTLRIKAGVGYHQFLCLVTVTVMPYHGVSVAVELAARGIAPSARTKEVHTGAAQRQVGMIVQAAGTRCPQRQRVIAVSPYITVYHDGARGSAIHRHLVGGGRVNRGAIVVIHRHTAYHAVVGTLKQFHDAFSHLLAFILSDDRLAVKLCHAYDGAVTVFAH